MDIPRFNAVCAALPHATHVVQWGGAEVWKVGGKIFALAAPRPRASPQISFKASDTARPILLERPGIIPAPYLARAGWVAVISARALRDDDLAAYLGEAHRVMAGKLPRRVRDELGLG